MISYHVFNRAWHRCLAKKKWNLFMNMNQGEGAEGYSKWLADMAMGKLRFAYKETLNPF